MASAEEILRTEIDTWLRALSINLTPARLAALLIKCSDFVDAMYGGSNPVGRVRKVERLSDLKRGYISGQSTTRQGDGTYLSRAIVRYDDGTIEHVHLADFRGL